jgi:hypothetical protein
LNRLRRILASQRRQGHNEDLREAIGGLLAYERAYRIALLGFERLLWLCRTLPTGAVGDADLRKDPVMKHVGADLPHAVCGLANALEGATTHHFRTDLARLQDVREFLQLAGSACPNPVDLATVIMARHREVQQGKFDRGRRKSPWIERTPEGKIALTMTRVGGLNREATRPDHIVPHPYRLGSADALIAAAGHGS